MKPIILLIVVLLLAPIGDAQSRRGSGGRGGTRRTDPVAVPEEPPASFKGTIRGISGQKVLVELEEGNTLELRCSRKTTFQRSGQTARFKDLEVGQRVMVEAKHGPDRSLDATSFQIEPAVEDRQTLKAPSARSER